MNERCSGRQSAVQSVGAFRLAETWHARGLRLPTHAHEVPCLHLVLDGLYEESQGATRFAVGPGGALFKPAGQAHANDFQAKGARSIRVEVPGAGVPLPTCAGTTHGRDPRLAGIAARMSHEVREADEFSPTCLEGLCLEALGLIGRARRSRPPRDRRVAEATQRLEERWNEALSMAELAESLGVHRSQLARDFRRHHGCTMGEYLRRRRIRWVMAELRSSSEPLVRLALRAGFSDQSHLCRVFRRLVGLSPAEYRRTTSGR